MRSSAETTTFDNYVFGLFFVVRSTGDTVEDQKILDRYLDKHPELRQTSTDLQKLFHQALVFQTLAMQIYQDGVRGRGEVSACIAFFTNGCLAAELLLKLLIAQGGDSGWGHKLDLLFDKLPPAVQQSLEAAAAADRTTINEFNATFRERLVNLRDGFESFRYFHEKKGLPPLSIEYLLLALALLVAESVKAQELGAVHGHYLRKLKHGPRIFHVN